MYKNSRKLLHGHNPAVPSYASQKSGTQLQGAIFPQSLIKLFIFNFSFLIVLGCGFDIEDPIPPDPPLWVNKSLPEIWPETGIDADESGGIYLEWDISQVEEIEATAIYRAQWFAEYDSLGDYTQIRSIKSSEPRNDNHIDITIKPGEKYYYKLRAIDFTGNMSAFSDSVHYEVFDSFVEHMHPNGTDDTLSVLRQLSWHYFFWIEMEDFCITILTNKGDLIFRESFMPTSYVGGYEQYSIPAEISFESGNIYRWRLDVGAKYLDGVETAGAESPWASFVYHE